MPVALAARPDIGILPWERGPAQAASLAQHMRNLKMIKMNLKLIVAISVLAAIPAVAAAQQATGPKPTKADVQKVVQIISGDKAKTSLYCDLGKLEDEMAQADEKKDQKKSEELGKQADAMGQKLGPEYIKLMAGLEQVDPDSNEGKDLSTALEALDKLCPKK
jgi:hypothetical protein